MITYNGIELDYRADTLQSLIIKGGLTKIDNLTDRTGTSSTQFNLPRTAKNELAFDNITTEGAQSQTSGAAYITIEGNVFSQGTLYVKGYDDKNFSCLFMGADNDLIGLLKTLPLRNVFSATEQNVYLDVNMETWMNSIGLAYSWGHPQMFNVALADRVFGRLAPFFRIDTMLTLMFLKQGITLNSNFLSSEYGQSLDWSNFDGTHLSHNGYTNGSIDISTDIEQDLLNIGTELSANNSIQEVTAGSNTAYMFNYDVSRFTIQGQVEYTSSPEIESCQLYIYVTSSTSGGTKLFDTYSIENDVGLLQDGTNEINIDVTRDFVQYNGIVFGYELKLKDGYSMPISGGNITFTNISINNDNIEVGDALNWGNYAGKQTQLAFLKKFLVQFNCVLDVDGDQAYIELQDEGTEPIGASPASLPSIASTQFDLTNLVKENTSTAIDYLQGDLVLLSQKIEETDFIKDQQMLPNQRTGSYIYELNTFANNSVETYEGGFNSLYDYVDFSLTSVSVANMQIAETWEDCVSSRFDFTGTYDGKYVGLSWTSSTGATGSVQPVIHWSRPIWFAKTWKTLFINTLNQKKNNKIIEVIFKDELGTIVSNRKEYIYKDQVYKIVEWSYDIIKKLVKAKLIMK